MAPWLSSLCRASLPHHLTMLAMRDVLLGLAANDLFHRRYSFPLCGRHSRWLDSPWGPPDKIFEQLSQDYQSVLAYYYEPGMAFCGRFEDGFDNQYEIPGSSEEVQDTSKVRWPTA